MSKPTKQFMDWFLRYGITDSDLPEAMPGHHFAAIKRMVWRAYKRGKADGMDQGFHTGLNVNHGIQMGD